MQTHTRLEPRALLTEIDEIVSDGIRCQSYLSESLVAMQLAEAFMRLAIRKAKEESIGETFDYRRLALVHEPERVIVGTGADRND